ncbi:hypothetical protein GGS26DRAFT_605086 [Hypomontagnella submonticulosa]|nr:hypothetical protein GGS26DRAFT_605086 [Hypomontagnella submonticulosa]
MPSSFHLFPLLPKELRDKIWDAAIRPEQPGAHFFSLIRPDHTEGEEHFEYFPPVDMVPLEPDKVWRDGKIAAPGCSPSSPTTLSWTANNPSLYTYDSGLWSACKESRERMEWRFKSKRWNKDAREHHFKDPSYVLDNKESNAVSTTGYFRTDESLRYFTTYPHQDLFCLQYRRRGTLKICNPWLESIDADVPFLSWDFGFMGPRNVGIEFDPEWALTEYSGISGIFWGLLGAYEEWMNCADTLWLIDTRIRRRDDAEIAQRLEIPLEEFLEKKGSPGYDPLKDRETFLCTDRVFVEGYEKDDWYTVSDPDDGVNLRDEYDEYTAAHFVKELKVYTGTDMPCFDCGISKCTCLPLPNFKFLVCERL